MPNWERPTDHVAPRPWVRFVVLASMATGVGAAIMVRYFGW